MRSLLITLAACLFTFSGFGQTLESFKDINTGFIGFKNAAGEIIIEANKYQGWNGVSLGMILVRKDNKWGYCDLKGNEIIACNYRLLYEFIEGLAFASLNEGEYGYIDKAGNVVIPFKYSRGMSFSEGRAAVQFNGKYGYIDKKGNTVIDYIYDYTAFYKEGLAAIKNNSKWGFIDENGKEICDIKYDDANDFSEGLAGVQIGGKYTFINKFGKEMMEPADGRVGNFKEGFAKFKLNGLFGFIDKTGKRILEPKYSSVNDFKEGYAKVSGNNKEVCTYINTKGIRITNSVYSSNSENFDQGYAIVEDQYHGNKGVINTDGKEVLELIYTSISLKDGVFTAVDTKGQTFKFDTLGDDITNKADYKTGGYFASLDESDMLFIHIDFSGRYFYDSVKIKNINNYLDYSTDLSSLQISVDKILIEAAKDKKAYQDFTSYLYNKYTNPTPACYRVISINIALKHLCNTAAPYGGAYWIDKTQLNEICKRAKIATAVACK